jgi:hypothetical protein
MALGFERNLKMHSRFSDLEYAAKTRVTRHDWFLREIDAVMPWSALVAEIGPFYPKVDGRGRPPVGLQQMLQQQQVYLLLCLSISLAHIHSPFSYIFVRFHFFFIH